MRVVVDYGLHTSKSPQHLNLPGSNQNDARGNGRVSRREPVIIIHKGSATPEGHGFKESNAPRQEPTMSEGLPVPGTDYVLRTSESAKERSALVKGHERMHQLALGAYASSGISYTTRRGPDGAQVVTGGSIKADLTPVPGDPRASLRKANAVRNAALAPGSPSAADMRVAAEAYRLAAEAKQELTKERLTLQA